MITNDLDYLRAVQNLDDMGELVHHEDRRNLDDWLVQNGVNRVPFPSYEVNTKEDDDYYFL